MVQAGQLTQPIIRPPGLRSITNPAPATGGADPDGPDDARQSAPLHTLTLDRVVAGRLPELRARLCRHRQGDRHMVVVQPDPRRRGNGGRGRRPVIGWQRNLAGVDRGTASGRRSLRAGAGHAVPDDAVLVGASILVDTPTYGTPTVLAAVAAALTGSFGFAARAIGQGVAKSEVVAAIQRVPGVLAVRLTAFAITPAPSMPAGLVLDDDGLPVFLPAPVAPPGSTAFRRQPGCSCSTPPVSATAWRSGNEYRSRHATVLLPDNVVVCKQQPKDPTVLAGGPHDAVRGQPVRVAAGHAAHCRCGGRRAARR